MWGLGQAALQVLRGGLQIVILPVELAQAHVHIGRAPPHGRALLLGKLQRLLIGPHGVVEPTLRNPYVRQGDCAPDCAREAPGLLQTRLARGKHPVRSLEIPSCPIRESEEPGCRSAREMVVLVPEVEHPLGVCHRAGHIV
jgi:hypothetical protein